LSNIDTDNGSFAFGDVLIVADTCGAESGEIIEEGILGREVDEKMLSVDCKVENERSSADADVEARTVAERLSGVEAFDKEKGRVVLVVS